MIIRWSVIFAIVLFVPEACKPQDVIEVAEPVVSGAPHSVYAEMGGNGLFARVNYDYLFMSGFGFRFGAGLSGLDDTDGVSFPLTANYVSVSRIGWNSGWELCSGGRIPNFIRWQLLAIGFNNLMAGCSIAQT